MKKEIFIIIIVGILANSCNGYLDKSPDSSLSITIDSEEKIAELLTGAYPKASYFSFLEARTDNVGERLGGDYQRLNEAMYYWLDFDLEDLDAPLFYWNSCYKGIAQVNQALESLKDYPKSQRVKALYAEALLLRAYLHFMLVNIWSKPYNVTSSKTDLGIPYMNKPEKNAIVNYLRLTVFEVYEKIEKDLLLGLSAVNDKYYKQAKFHFNKEAAYAFAARFYLYKGEWEKVLDYSNWVLGNNPSLRLRDWYDHDLRSVFGYPVGEEFSSASKTCNLLITTTESRLFRNYTRQKYGLNLTVARELFERGLSSSDRNLTWSYTYGGGEMVNVKKFAEFSKYSNTGYNPREIYVPNILFSFDEVLLNRAEAYIMLSRDNEAIFDITLFVNKKLGKTYNYEDYLTSFPKAKELYHPFYKLSEYQANLIQLVSELRRKEYVLEGLRWFDIRRFNLVVNRNKMEDVVNPSLILGKDDNRRILQIPQQAIDLGMIPNPR